MGFEDGRNILFLHWVVGSSDVYLIIMLNSKLVFNALFCMHVIFHSNSGEKKENGDACFILSFLCVEAV